MALPDAASWLPILRRLHRTIRLAVVEACERATVEALSGIAHESEGDTIYAIDRVGEDALVEGFARELPSGEAIVLVAEGLAGGRVVLPRGAAEHAARWVVIVDPIDGTRGLMYQKRSAWILTGVAPNRGASTSLADVEVAVQTEIPLVKQHLADTVWAVRGQGARAERWNRVTGVESTLALRPSGATTIAGGFATLARFFPGGRDLLSAIDDEVALGAAGPMRPGRALTFEDQYICTGGQLYELMAGHDRFIADLRLVAHRAARSAGETSGLCCHPYDLATELVAREAGVIVTDERGRPLDAPLAVDADVAWIGYANARIRQEIEPLLMAALERRGLR